MSELLDSLTTTVGRGLPEPYVAREVLAVASKAMKLHNETERDLAEAVGLLWDCRDAIESLRPFAGGLDDHESAALESANAFLARFGKDTL